MDYDLNFIYTVLKRFLEKIYREIQHTNDYGFHSKKQLLLFKKMAEQNSGLSSDIFLLKQKEFELVGGLFADSTFKQEYLKDTTFFFFKNQALFNTFMETIIFLM